MRRNDGRRVKTSASRAKGASLTRVYSRAFEHDEEPSEGSAAGRRKREGESVVLPALRSN